MKVREPTSAASRGPTVLAATSARLSASVVIADDDQFDTTRATVG